MVMLDHKAYLDSVKAILVVLGGFGGCWMIMIYHGAYLAFM